MTQVACSATMLVLTTSKLLLLSAHPVANSCASSAHMAGALRNAPPKGPENEANEHSRTAREEAPEYGTRRDSEEAEDSASPRATQSFAVLMSVRGGLRKE